MRSLLLAFAVVTGCVHPVPPGPDVSYTPGPSEPLPFDADVRTGHLENGFTWYIDENERPSKRAVLWLVVRAGSVEEDADQVGLAHFVEHMAFNGTTHFPRQEMTRFLESSGMSMGPHANAYTGYDETVYQLQVPTDDPALFAKAFEVLADIASQMTFDSVEVEKERGVVLEEWRRGRGASGRLEDQIDPLLFFGSPYAAHRPIGTQEAVRSFSSEAAVRFYRDWYRPDRMALIAVGEFDHAVVEAHVRESFSGLVNVGAGRTPPSTALPPQEETFYNIFVDPELTAAEVVVVIKHDDVEGGSHAAYRDTLLDLVVLHAVNRRLQHMTRQENAPCVEAGGGPARLTPTEGEMLLGCTVQVAGAERGLEALLVEARRVRELGITEAEVALARTDLLASIDLMKVQKETRPSGERAAELVRHVMTAEPVPGINYEAGLWQAWLPGIHAAEVSGRARELFSGDGLLVHVEMPAREGLAVPTVDDLRTVEAAVAKAVLAPVDQVAALPPLVETEPVPGTVVERSYDEALNLHTWTLSNGLKVLVKPTDFQREEVVFRAWSPGGMSLVPDDRFVSARTAVAIASRSGLGALDVETLQKVLAGRQFTVDPWIDDSFDGMAGKTTPRDLETALQVVYLTFTAPRFTQEALDLEKQKRARALADRRLDPKAVFDDAYDILMWQDHPRHRAWTVDRLEEMDLEATLAVWHERFGDPADFTFLFVGSVDLAETERLVTAWLGSIPSTGHREIPGDDGARRVAGVREEVVRAGIEPKARVTMTYNGPFTGSWAERAQLDSMGDILEVLLREELREEMGGTYKVSVSNDTWQLPEPGYKVAINFQCDPTRVDELIRRTREIVEALRTTGPDGEYVKNEQAMSRRTREPKLKTNEFWAMNIKGALQREEDPHELLRWDVRNDALSPKVIRNAARLYLDATQVVTMVLLPAEAGAVPTGQGSPCSADR